jgi:GT2 family glycosyltransferase
MNPLGNLNIRIVCATRSTDRGFYEETALGKSLAAAYLGLPFIEVALFPSNTTGLPVLYNRVIREAAANPAVLVFAHDDLHLIDYYWPDRLYGALLEFQIVGLVGNRFRKPRQPSWCFKDEWFAWDDFENMSGFMGHGETLPNRVTRFGRVGAECKLLDGVFLAAESPTLVEHGLDFDEAFDFHFYDLDLCRQAERKGVRMGTAAICALHESIGKMRTAAWRAAFETYLAKWGE